MSQCLVYCRVSTEEQAEKGYSLDTQERLCRDFAERSGYRVAGVFRDEGKSGTTLDRPALQDLLAKCTENESISAVIVQETDRLARNTHDHLTIRALLQKAGVKLISVAQPMLDDSPEGKMIDTILASVNQFQSDINSRKTRKALQEKFNQGWWPGWAPLGYLNVALDTSDGGHSPKIVGNDPERWHLLREGFSLYLTGSYSADALRELLNEKGLRSKNGKKIPHSIMVNTLKNPFYAGLMVWKDQRKVGRHEPMISLHEHERVLEIIDTHNFHVARTRKHGFLLRGFVFCGRCGQRYTAEHHPKKRKSYYHCATMQGHSNRNQNVAVAELEQQVQEQFKTVQFSKSFVASMTDKLRYVRNRHLKTANARKQVLSNQQKAIEAKLSRAEEKLLAGVLGDDAFVRLRTDLSGQLQGIQTEILKLDTERMSESDVIHSVLQLTRNLYQEYQKAPDAWKRQYLGLFWDRFVVQDRHIVQAIPTDLIRALQEEGTVMHSDAKLRTRAGVKAIPARGNKTLLPADAANAVSMASVVAQGIQKGVGDKSVITTPKWLPSSPLVIILQNRAYLAGLAAKIEAIRTFPKTERAA